MNRKYKDLNKIILVILSSFFIGGFNILLSFMIQIIIDNVLLQINIFKVTQLLLLLLVFTIIYPFIYNINIKLSKIVDLENRENVLNTIINHQLNMELSSQEQLKESDYLMLLNEDLENYSNKLSRCYIPLFQHTVTIIVALIYGFYYSYKISLAVLIFVSLYHLINNLVLINVLNKKEKHLNNISNSKQFLFNSIENIPILRLFNLKKQLKNKMEKYLSEESSQRKSISKIEVINNISGEAMIQGIEFAVFLLGVYYNLKGEISFGVVVGLWNGLIGSILWSSVELPYIYQDLSSALASEKRIKSFFDIPLKRQQFKEKIDFSNGKVSTLGLEYKFPKSEKKLIYDDMTFENTGIAIITGNSGSGKSTLAKLLTDLYIPFNGKVLKNNVGMFYVSQSHEVFPLSIRDNIKLGEKEITDDEINDVLEKVGLKKSFINEKRTLNSLIDREKVSGGEAQRIGIARSIIRKNQYIIMDEPFANLDYLTSMELIKLIKNLSNTYSFIIITHIFIEEFEGYKIYSVDERGKDGQ